MVCVHIILITIQVETEMLDTLPHSTAKAYQFCDIVVLFMLKE